jgi:2-oxoglutarate dehydrogenase E2 component (dihydrolipoamide succinyltransferase)
MSQPVEVKVPCENVNDPTARVVSWKSASGVTVKEGDVVVELENSKATFPVTAPASGVVWHRHLEGDEIPVGETLFVIGGNGFPSKSAGASSPIPGQVAPAASSAEVMFSRRARELLGDLGLDADLFKGMPQVRESDVMQKARELGRLPLGVTQGAVPPPPGSASSAAIASQPPSPAAGTSEEGELVPLDRAKHLENRELAGLDRAAIKSTIFCLCAAAGLQEVCKRQSPPTQRLAVALFETARLLRKYRPLNSYYAAEAMFAYHKVNLGFAVDLGRGLKVLVIRDADTLSFSQLGSKFEELLVKYSTGGLGVLDVTGSTFTVTDLGQEGAFTFVPVINARQAAILGLGAELPDRGGLPGGFMLSCTFDHRLMAGKLVAEFLAELSTRLVGHSESLSKAAGANVLCCSRCLQTVEQLRRLRAFLLPSVEPPGYICTNCLTGF